MLTAATLTPSIASTPSTASATKISTATPTTPAFRLSQLRKELLEMSDVENAAYLLDFLYTHSFKWATKQYCMTDINAGKYAAWFVRMFGEEWVNDVTAPPHSGWTIFKYARSLAHDGT